MTKREKLLNANVARYLDITDAETGENLRVVRPSLATTSLIQAAGEKSSADSVVAVCLHCVVDPVSGQKVFKPTDADGLREMPLDGWLAEVMKAFARLNDREANEAEGKGEPPTPAVG